MSEFPISNGPFGSGGNEQGLNQILQERQSLVQSQLSQLQPKGPSMFRQVLGGVVGMAGNVFAPGLGGALGRMIGGAGANGSFGSGSSAAFANNLASSAAAANASNLAGAEALNAAAEQSNQDEELISLQANLEKARHESFMAVINTIGSS